MLETVMHIVGHVGTDVDHRKVGESTDLSTFRLATTPRRWDRDQRAYVDGTTTWITVQCWRQLALHVRDSVRRGDPVVVVGRLKTEEWTKDEVRNSRCILEATSVGHDLMRGVSAFTQGAAAGRRRLRGRCRRFARRSRRSSGSSRRRSAG